MKKASAARSVVAVTLLTLVNQVLMVFLQSTIAKRLGAGPAMDAYLTANALPQYVNAVVLATIGSVFFPIFVECRERSEPGAASRLLSNVVNLCVIGGGLALVCALLASGTLIRITAPGLDPEVRRLAAKLAVIVWPTMLTSAAAVILKHSLNADRQFGLPEAVVAIGTVVNLSIVFLLHNGFSVSTLAIAYLSGAFVQVLLLVALVWRRYSYSWIARPSDPLVKSIFVRAGPLIAAYAVCKFTSMLEPMLASRTGVGGLSLLSYASRIAMPVASLVSVGIATIVFTKFATHFAKADGLSFRRDVSKSLRFMWLAVAPITTIGIALALPVVRFLYERGNFSHEDSAQVGGLLQILLVSVTGNALGSITSKALYASDGSKLLAILGVIEAVIYIVYTSLLSNYYGIAGIAAGYTTYMSISLIWQLGLLWRRTGGGPSLSIIRSFLITGGAAVAGGLAAWLVQSSAASSLSGVLLGGILATAVYVGVALALRSSEVIELTCRFLNPRLLPWTPK